MENISTFEVVPASVSAGAGVRRFYVAPVSPHPRKLIRLADFAFVRLRLLLAQGQAV